MKTYNEEYVPNMFGLVNTGAICYLNSMLQALVSCSAFNQHLLENQEAYEAAAESGNKIGVLLIRLLNENGLSGDLAENMREFKIGRSNGQRILQALIAQRRQQNSRYNLHQHQQEGFHEGLVFLLEALVDADKSIADLFNIRYRMMIQCRNCGDERAGPRAPPEYMFNLFDEDPMIQDNLNSKEAIESYIKQHAMPPDDFKCEKCNIQNTQDADGNVSKHITQVYSLARLSSILVLVFNKYEQKKLKYFPPELDFKSKTGILHYEVMAQIEHYGDKNSGHYLAKCRRPKPKDFGEFMASKQIQNTQANLERLRKKQASLKRRLDSEQSKLNQGRARNITASTRKVTNFRKQLGPVDRSIRTLEAKLEHLNQNIGEDPLLGQDSAVFHINDTQVGIDPNGFMPTRNTYVVVYQLISEFE